MNQKISSGFTLIELMTVVLIIGILAAVGLPQYSQYVHKAKVSEGIVAVNAVSKIQKVFYQENGYFYGATSSTGILSEIDLFSSGSKMLFNYVLPDNTRAMAEGSRSYFLVVTYAGDYDESGNLSSLANRDTDTGDVILSTSGENESMCIQGGGGGGDTHLTGVDFGLQASPSSKYAFVVIKALATLRGGGGGLMGLLNNQCTTLLMSHDIGSSGIIETSPIMQFSIGE